MDIVLIIIAGLFMILGILGSFLPVLPGPITSWIGLLILHFTEAIPLDWTFLTVTLVISVAIWLLDYFIPVIGTKKFGGSRAGMIGTTIGLIIGLIFMGPLGIIIGPFLGALVGELINRSDSKTALKSAIGSFLGFVTGVFLKFVVAMIFLGYYIKDIWNYYL